MIRSVLLAVAAVASFTGAARHWVANTPKGYFRVEAEI